MLGNDETDARLGHGASQRAIERTCRRSRSPDAIGSVPNLGGCHVLTLADRHGPPPPNSSRWTIPTTALERRDRDTLQAGSDFRDALRAWAPWCEEARPEVGVLDPVVPRLGGAVTVTDVPV
jgi:hypothetical protein